MTRVRFPRSITPAVCVPVLISLLAFGAPSPAARANGPAPTPTVCYGPTQPCVAISPVAGGIHPTPTAASRQTSVRTHVQVRAHGLLLGLTVPSTTYPQNALVRVSISLRNVTNHTIWLLGGGPPQPGKSFPQVEALDGQGNVVFPPVLDGYFPYPGPGPESIALPRGKVMRGAPLAVLRGPYLRATVPVLGRARQLGTTTELATPSLRLRLTGPDAPQVHLTVSGDRITAAIESATPVAGRMLYVDAALCGGTDFAEQLSWTAGSRTLSPGCGPVQAWYLTAGWLNHSVAIVAYKPG